jgi:5-methylcytosine-specific restriction protein A
MGKVRDPFYVSPKWLALRKAALERDRFQCVTPRCGKRATHVDHIVSRRRGGADALTNLVCLCPACHSRKTDLRDGGFGRKPSHRLAVDAEGWPIVRA